MMSLRKIIEDKVSKACDLKGWNWLGPESKGAVLAVDVTLQTMLSIAPKFTPRCEYSAEQKQEIKHLQDYADVISAKLFATQVALQDAQELLKSKGLNAGG